MKSEQQLLIPGAMDKVTMPPERVRGVRNKLGLQQRELATLFGVRPQTVSRWERVTGAGGPARTLLGLLDRDPGILTLLGLNAPARKPDGKV